MTQTQPAPAALRSRTYEWTDPSIVAAKLGSMSGIDQLRTMIAGDLPAPPIMATLDIEPLEAIGEGTVQVYLTSQEFHYNPLGSMHGGVISALLDTAAGCAVHTTLAPGFGYTSLDLHTRFLRPATLDSDVLRCTGTVLSRTRRSAVAEARLEDASGRLIGHATSSCLIFDLPTG